MLTKEGYRSRVWRGYPQLRRLFERGDDPVPGGVDLLELLADDEPRISTDQGPLGRLSDVLAISRLLASQGGAAAVQDAMRADLSSVPRITEEVDHLCKEVEDHILALQHFLANAGGREIERTRTVAREVQECGWRLRSNA